MKKMSFLAVVLSLSTFHTTALEAPTSPVILKVAGNIKAPESMAGEVVQLDLAMLQALPQHDIITSNPWVDKPHIYRGPRVSDIFAAVGAQGNTVTLTALNGYQINIDWQKVEKYNPILAWQDNGVTMRVRDKGPLWFMLPLDKHPELKRAEFTDMMIWQLSSIDIQR